MKLLNICYPKEPGYHKTLDVITDAIVAHLPQETYKITQIWDPNALNVVYGTQGPEKNLKSIHVPHGISDKGVRTGKTMQKYGMTFVSSPVWKEKLIAQGLEPERILVGGWPKLDIIFNNPKPRPEKYQGKIIVLWAPTHTNDSNSTFYAMNSFNQWPDDIVIIKSPHPWDRHRCRLPSLQPTMWDLTIADVVISDASSIIYESWVFGKHVMFLDWVSKETTLHGAPSVSYNRDIYEQNIGIHVPSEDKIIDMIYHSQQIPLDPRSIDIAEAVLPTKLRGKSGKATAKELLKQLQKRQP